MERFIVSARKYRPNSFETLIGQDNIAATLQNSILKNQLAHAYLFCGPRGVGKTTSARIFAKTINCLNPLPGMHACNECESCVSFNEGRSYSIHELDAASNNSVDDIRMLNEKVRIPPQIGKYSVFIIDEVHMLSQSAFNAFLKTLEEPPAHAIFILATTEKHKIIPTILSRCQTYDFNRISVEDIVRNLKMIAGNENITADEESLHIIAQKADGAMRDALTIFDQMVAFCGSELRYSDIIKNLNVLDYEYYFKITDIFLNGDYSGALLLFDEILGKGFNPLHFIGGLSTHFRDLLLCKDQATGKLLELSPGLLQRYSEQAGRCSFQFIYQALDITTTCEAGFKTSNNQRLHVEFALVKISKLSDRGAVEPSATVTTNQTAKSVEREQAAEISAQPAPTEKPVAKDIEESDTHETANEAPAKKSSQTAPSTLSIKALIANAEKRATISAERVNTEPKSEDFSENDLDLAWKGLVESEKALPRLANALANNPPRKGENYEVHFTVSNESQKSWIEKNCLARINDFLRGNLKNDGVKLVIDVTPADAPVEQKLYMPGQKAKFLLENNPELIELKKDLDLDIN